MRRLTNTIIFQARNLRKPLKQPSDQTYKLKFTEQELSEMSIHNPKQRRSIKDIFQQKIDSLADQANKSNPDLKIVAPKIVKKKQASAQQKIQKSLKEKFKFFQMTKQVPKQQRLKPSQATLDQLTQIRLNPQFLPISYLKKVQKIFHKYDQMQLRDIADNFSKIMRLRYSQEKINYDLYPDLKFAKIQLKLPKEKQVQQIYLTSMQKMIEHSQKQQEEKIRKEDQEEKNPQINYTQNIIISYLLKRAPRTYATAIRILLQIKYKYPTWSPQSMIDFGSGLSSGSLAFIDCWKDTGKIYNIQPNSKMRKLSKYLMEGTSVQHFQTLGQLSRSVRQVDIIYAGYVLNELKPDLVDVYLQALYCKTKPGGLLIFSEYGNPFGARLIHEVRKWALKKQGNKIIAPCPHQLACPLSKGKQWCHFDQPSGMYSRRIFGKLPTDHTIQFEKFSYLVVKKSTMPESEENQDTELTETLNLKENITDDWDRVIFPTMKKKRHILFNICTKEGKYERRISAKSYGQQYKIAKKLSWGDLWRLGKRIPNKFRKQRKTGKRIW